MAIIRSLMTHLGQQYKNNPAKAKSVYNAMMQESGGTMQGLHAALKRGAFNHNRGSKLRSKGGVAK